MQMNLNQRSEDQTERHFYINGIYAAIGGVVAALVMAALVLVVGAVSTYEAGMLLDAMLPTVRFLCSSAAAASSTTLALMLTLLGLSASVSHNLKNAHYVRIRQIALLDSIGFVLSIILLLTLVVPYEQTEEISAAWYTPVYYFVVIASAALGGIMVTVILMIYGTVRDMVSVFVSGVESNLVNDQDVD